MTPMSPCKRRPGAAAAVEVALLPPFFVLLSSRAPFLGRGFRHSTAVHKAAQHAQRYLATISWDEMRAPALAPAAAEIARDIAGIALAGPDPGQTLPRVEVQRGGKSCSGVKSDLLPETVAAIVRMDMFDPVFEGAVVRHKLVPTAYPELRYGGN